MVQNITHCGCKEIGENMEKKRLTIIVVLTTVILIASLGAFLYFYEKKKANYFYLFTGDVNMIKWYYNKRGMKL